MPGTKKKTKKTKAEPLMPALDDYRRFEELLFSLSANFINLPADDIDKEIKNCLKLLGEFLDIDRVSLTQFDDKREVLFSTHFYTAPGVPKPSIKIVNKSIPWFFKQIKDGKLIALKHVVEDLPRHAIDDREYARTFGVKSVITIPLGTGENIVGGLFFTLLKKHMAMPKELLKKLVLACDILTRVLWKKKAWEQIQKHTRLERLLSEISAMFINISQDELEDKINNSFAMISEHLEVDFFFMRQQHKNFDGYRIIHSWQRPGVEMLKKVSLAPENTPWIYKHLQQNKPCQISTIDDFPKEAALDKATAHAMGIKSFISVPISAKGMFKGAIAVGTVNSYRTWPDNLVEQLKLIGEVFSNSILRRQAERKLQTALTEIKQLKEQAEKECHYLREEIKLDHNFYEIIGNSDALQQTLFKVQQVAKTNATVLISGETGTGKELIARAIHNTSDRCKRPLVKINCATLPANLIESELFGHEKGAFSGAHSSRQGRFELGNRATLFLDEIGELPIELQPKLLRVLQEGEFEKLGSSKTFRTDARIIAATNRDLEGEVKAGRFRQDLWYRLNVFPIRVPPLRERKEDIPLLVNCFVKKQGKQIGKQIRHISKKTMIALKRYNWPGNVRELQNLIERSIITSEHNSLTVETPQTKEGILDSYNTLEEMEYQYILYILEKTKWVIEGKHGACSRLGLKPSTLRSRMKKLKICRP
jgi:formate hydrogenlyase transcriptional activator